MAGTCDAIDDRSERTCKIADSSVAVVIPTLGREQVLIDTVRALLACTPNPTEIIVVDQTLQHEFQTEKFLHELCESGQLRWLRLDKPSIPRAMNTGLRAARSAIVLFVDDDILPAGDLVAAHAAAHVEFPDVWAVAGQVLQPGESPARCGARMPGAGFLADLEFPFWSDERAFIANVMAGNLSVKRNEALSAGGFDENFEGVAYRFETEFARRLVRRGGRILFEPAASLRHLRAKRGGTRVLGSHLTSASPRYGMGDYYFAMQSGWSFKTVGYMLRRPLREVVTRFHMRHPWYIPIKLIGEIRAFLSGLSQWFRGPQLQRISHDDRRSPSQKAPIETAIPHTDDSKCLKP